jgi:hypothetical protein
MRNDQRLKNHDAMNSLSRTHRMFALALLLFVLYGAAGRVLPVLFPDSADTARTVAKLLAGCLFVGGIFFLYRKNHKK